MKRKPFAEDVDDVHLGSWPIGTLWGERVDMAVDGGQLRFNGLLLVDALIEMPIEYVDGVAQLHHILINGELLHDERLPDADIVERVAADGIDFGGKKRIAHLSINRASGYC